MYAIIETGGKQYKVEEGSVIFVEKLNAEAETKVDFKVVAVGTEGDFVTGDPYVVGHRQPYTKVEITSISM